MSDTWRDVSVFEYTVNAKTNTVHLKSCRHASLRLVNTITCSRIYSSDRACSICLPHGLPLSTP